jgi:hypothetical protein
MPAPEPYWESDSFSEVLKNAEYNTKGHALMYPDVFALLRDIHAAFGALEGVVEHGGGTLLIPRFLVGRIHAAFIGAVRLALAGEQIEACAVVRQMIEQAWYALHITQDAEKRSVIWLSRNDDEASLAAMKKEFTIGNVSKTHASLDALTEKELHRIYEMTIDYGAHPNPKALFGAFGKTETEKDATFHVGILWPDPLPMMLAVRVAVSAAVGVFKVYELIFPSELKAIGFADKIDSLVTGLNTVFKKFAPPPSSS